MTANVTVAALVYLIAIIASFVYWWKGDSINRLILNAMAKGNVEGARKLMIAHLEGKKAETVTERAALIASGRTATDPDVKALDTQIANLTKEITDARKRIRP